MNRPLDIGRAARSGAERRRGVPGEEARPSRGSSGFSLIELLVAMVIIAVLASVAIFRVYEGKRRAQLAVVRQDLKNLVSAQEAYFSDSQEYAGTLTLLTGYGLSEGVTIELDSATTTGWGARGTHAAIPDECEVIVSGGATGIVHCGG